MKKEEKPYIICHMLASINGKITGSFFGRPETKPAAQLYQTLHHELKADAVAYGRTTVDEGFTKGRKPELAGFQGVNIPREDFVATAENPYYLAVVDPVGGLGWDGPFVQGRGPGYDGAHIIEVLTEKTPDAYLAYLKQKGISYIFAGKEKLIPEIAVRKLFRLFGIRRMLLQGGGITNGTFADLIDEISLIIAPVTECGSKNLTVFEEMPEESLEETGKLSQGWRLSEARQMEDSVIWMRYRKEDCGASCQ